MAKIADTLSLNLSDAVEAVLKHWKQESLVATRLQYLYVVRFLCRHRALPARQAIQQVIHEAIHDVAIQNPLVAELLRRRYFGDEIVYAIAHDKGMGESTAFRLLDEGRELVVQRIQELEEEAKAHYFSEFTKRLEAPTYTHLIGTEKAVAQLTQVLLSEEAPWLIAIEGLGGIGKTALADALVRHLIEYGLVYDLAWVTARQRSFAPGLHATQVLKPALTSAALLDTLYTQLIGPRPATFTQKEIVAALTRLCKAHPYLIFIDNLETVVDVEELLPLIRGLVNPTQVVLTSRYSLFGHSDIYLFAAGELSVEDSLTLLRQEAGTHHLPEVAQVDDGVLLPLVERTGGNPLAIKLVVGLLHVHSLAEIVHDLTSTRSNEINQLYDFIYLRAWQALTEIERHTLLAMPLIDELGGTLEDLAGISHLDRDALHRAMEQLARLNLVNSRGTYWAANSLDEVGLTFQAYERFSDSKTHSNLH